MNFYKHHLGDYAQRTAHLSMIEDGAYRRLLDLYYSTQKPIPTNRRILFRLLRANSSVERKAVETVLMEFFVESEGSFRQQRCDEEIAQYEHQASTNRRIARERIEKRIVDEQVNESSNETSDDSLTNRSTNHTPNQNQNQNQEPENTKTHRARKKPASAMPVSFGENWSEPMKIWLEKYANGQTKAYLLWFISHAKAKGWMYVDWEQAFQNSIREDWAGIRKALNAVS